jgi:ABC-2 type transport system ATP-binding protein
MSLRRWVALAVPVLFTLSLLNVPAIGETAPESITISGAKTSQTDSTLVKLDSDLYLPETTPAPAIVLAHGFGGNKTSVQVLAKKLQAAGYVVLAYTARGFGNSTGSISMNSPEYEISDAARIIDYLTGRPEVIKDSNNDPKVGFAGGSYGGALSLMIAGSDSRVDAIAADITWNNLTTALFPQSAIGLDAPGVYKQLWTGFFFSRGLTTLNLENPRCGRFALNWCALYESIAKSGTFTNEQAELMFKSSPASTNTNITAPTLIMAGQADSLFPLAEADANYQQIKAANSDLPLKLIWHSGGHDGGRSETERLNNLTLAWFDKYLREKGEISTDFEVTFVPANIISANQPDSSAIVESAPIYFGLSNATQSLPIAGPPQTILAPAGGAPAAISTFPGIGSIGGLFSQQIPSQTAFFQTAPLTENIKIIGSSQVELKVSSPTLQTDAVLFASLRIVGANGSSVLPNGLVAPIKLPAVSNQPTEILVSLPAIATEVKVGESIQVVLSTTDLAYRLPTEPANYLIELATPELAIATASTKPTVPIQSGWIFVWLTIIVIIALGAILFLLRPRHLTSDSNSDIAEIPVVINNLVKQFKNGPRAVNDISYQIPAGKVVGLLGPNGAGKTTTMRMMMGLIQPTSGSVYVFGERITPGAAVLSRIGSLVEGSGFLPHLTGRENLELYWQATGRSGDSNLEVVLEIADLGTAVNRKVRTYSQGMRQRLGIAQAMLGMPDLLILDEPTNGLDPPQIKAMRDVLHNYVEQGKTVIVSSHLLSEVEQTCSYVVVMHRGQLITSGEVKELLASRSNMRLEDFFLDVVGDDLTIGKT